ncbi:MAG: DNA photolyase [Candidatus Desulfatibia sp.]|uniref:SPL family radical SAM protein n=1 Tax=Candidatus Desulfatibia sp. TaxID=3101189 RepID=UPI002F2F7DA9
MTDKQTPYAEKFQSTIDHTFYSQLGEKDRLRIRAVAGQYRITTQEIRNLCIIARDLEMWQSGTVDELWNKAENSIPAGVVGPQRKKRLFQILKQHVAQLREKPTIYPIEGLAKPERPKMKLVSQASDKKILGWCPVASEKTLCCNLHNIDVVENCLYGCSYCTIQTFYDGHAIQDADLAEKLAKIELEPGRYYHITTGQASDSLAWGDKNGMLSLMCDFAHKHPDILLEFKTKSANIAPLLRLDVPPNIVCSWSLNPEIIITNEEHFTASLDERLAAAQKVADNGIKTAFHFHPMIHYQGWEQDYPALATKIMVRFNPQNVLFISFGAVTFIKPVLKKIRERGENTRIHQMELVPDPHGKLSNSDEIKIKLFRSLYRAFKPWHDQVFMYLCMERAEYWDQVFGYRYADNSEFEKQFGENVMRKVYPSGQ